MPLPVTIPEVVAEPADIFPFKSVITKRFPVPVRVWKRTPPVECSWVDGVVVPIPILPASTSRAGPVLFLKAAAGAALLIAIFKPTGEDEFVAPSCPTLKPI